MNDKNRLSPSAAFGQLDQMWFRLRSITHSSRSSGGWPLRLQFLESYMLLIPIAGQSLITVDGEYRELKTGAVFVCLPGQLIETSLEDAGEQSVYILRFDVFSQHSMPEEKQPFLPAEPHLPFPLEGAVAVQSTITYSKHCEAITHCLESPNPLQRLLAQSRFYELLYSLLSSTGESRTSDTDAAMERAKLYIEQHYREEITIGLLAAEAGTSIRHFIRLFKQRYGLSAIEYLTEYRIRQARSLMLPHTDYDLKDIAAYVGYKDVPYFRRKFKQITGIAPAAFMRNAKQKIAVHDSILIGVLLPLNIIPCAAPAEHPWTEYYRRKYETDAVLPLAEDQTLRLQQLAALHPDYILGLEASVNPPLMMELQAIAPTFLLCQTDWRSQLICIGECLGKTPDAEVWLDNYERKAKSARAELVQGPVKDKLLIARITGQTITVLSHRSLAEVFYNDLHYTPPSIVDRKLSRQTLTLEELESADADLLLFIVDEDADSQAAWSLIRENELLQSPAPAGHFRIGIEQLPPSPWTEYTAFTHELVLDLAPTLWRNRT
ncbi:AraC family transcriptional regulator [Paenibacillus piscarius]|uniref:AraC family transcriptional regulator n=1 Tax=Paenibacillus piscarius TaxID=1089681 RepID=UPI001EE8D45E|nr:AraC family transcriptional regulator [Paenibacillus piscarius]